MSGTFEHSGETIMVVDDDPSIRDFLRLSLENAGFKIIVEKDAIGALKTLTAQPPDLILLDIMMPQMDGLSMCKAIKANPEFSNIPVIFVTASVERDNVKKAIDAGAHGFIAKPLQHENLLQSIRDVLKGRFLIPAKDQQTAD